MNPWSKQWAKAHLCPGVQQAPGVASSLEEGEGLLRRAWAAPDLLACTLRTLRVDLPAACASLLWLPSPWGRSELDGG